MCQLAEVLERRGSLGKLSAMVAILLHFLSLNCTKTGLLECVLPLERAKEQVEKAEAAFGCGYLLPLFCGIIKSQEKTVYVATLK